MSFSYLKGTNVLKIPWTYFWASRREEESSPSTRASTVLRPCTSFRCTVTLLTFKDRYQGSFILIGSLSGILFYHEMEGASVLLCVAHKQ